MKFFRKSKEPKAPKPYTGENLVIFGDISDDDLRAVFAEIGKHSHDRHDMSAEYYWTRRANPRIARFNTSELQEFRDGYNDKYWHSTDQTGIGILAKYVSEYFHEKFGYRLGGYYLVFSYEAMASITDDDHTFTFLQLLRHLDGGRYYLQGTVIVKGGQARFTRDREDYLIRRLANSF